MTNKDQFGFYQVGNNTFYSKVEAKEYSNRVRLPVHWNFNDQAFAQFDWLQEPPVSLEQLYMTRAQQIRERYDYVVVWYSGGADSHNMLQSFLKSGLHVDEIAQFHCHGADGNWESYLNQEVSRVAVPETQKIQEQYPHIKHRLVDLSLIIKDLYQIDDNATDFIYKANKIFSPNQLSRTYLRERVQDYADIIASGRSLCFVWGAEKPSLQQVDGRYCVYFADVIDNAVGVRTQQLNRPWEHDELFYWTPDFPEVVCKQAHIIRRFCRSIKEHNIDLMLKNGYLVPATKWDPARKRGDITAAGQRYTLNDLFVHRLIYPWWDPNTFSNGKNPSGLFSHRDLWWFRDYTQEDQSRFRYGILKLEHILGQDRMVSAELNKSFMPEIRVNLKYLGTQSTMSNNYYIE